MKKRILSCLMALVLCLTLLPTAALAGETEGTAQTPFFGCLRAKSRLTAVALRNTPAGVVPRTLILTIAENLPLYRQSHLCLSALP